MTAFVFSGQGAQNTGMGKDVYYFSSKAREVFEIAENKRPGLKDLCFSGSKEELSITLNTQPCVFTVDLASAAALYEKGIKPDVCAGFSLGEIAALAFSGVLTYEDAIKLVIKRAELMQKASEKNSGVMVAVLGVPAEIINETARKYISVETVNFNCPGQTVVACASSELLPFSEEMKQKGAKIRQIAVSGAFHSHFMNDAAKELGIYLKDVKVIKSSIPVYANFTASLYGDSEEEIRSNIENQVNHAVLWEKSIRAMILSGVNRFIEVGEGKVLCGLISKIDSDVTVIHYKDIFNKDRTVQEC